jgi:hypothetical protein
VSVETAVAARIGMGLTSRAEKVRGGSYLAGLDSAAPMAGGGAPELLMELLSDASKTPAGRAGLLKTAQVADVLGRSQGWVHEHARLLGGFRLPGSDEWRFSPRGVAMGVFDRHDAGPSTTTPPRTTRAPGASRLPYPPARQLLTDQPRRLTSDRDGGP